VQKIRRRLLAPPLACAAAAYVLRHCCHHIHARASCRWRQALCAMRAPRDVMFTLTHYAAAAMICAAAADAERTSVR